MIQVIAELGEAVGRHGGCLRPPHCGLLPPAIADSIGQVQLPNIMIYLLRCSRRPPPWLVIRLDRLDENVFTHD